MAGACSRRCINFFEYFVGDGVPAPLCGVLPMVALTPKGVRYLDVPFAFAESSIVQTLISIKNIEFFVSFSLSVIENTPSAPVFYLYFLHISTKY